MARQSQAQNGDGQAVSRVSRRWLPGQAAGLLVLSLVMLAALALIGSASAQDGSESTLASDPWATYFCLAPAQCELGDFNGDGKTDILMFYHSFTAFPSTQWGWVDVRLSNGAGFDPPTTWRTDFCTGNKDVCKVGDFNADGKDDIIAFARGYYPVVRVALSSNEHPNTFDSPGEWNSYFCYGNQICDVGDFNGDHYDDIVTFARSTESAKKGDVYVGINRLKDGSATFTSNGTDRVSGWFCIDYQLCGTGDFNGDGYDDVITFEHGPCYATACSGQVWVATSNGSPTLDGLEFLKNANNGLWKAGPFCVYNAILYPPPSQPPTTYQEVCGIGDFDGNGRDDIITYLRNTWADKIGQVDVALSRGADFGGSKTWSSDFCTGDQFCGTGNYYDLAAIPYQSYYGQVSRTGNFNGLYQGLRQDDVVRFLRSTALSTQPGYVYVKIASGTSFVDPPAFLPPAAWLPLIFR